MVGKKKLMVVEELSHDDQKVDRFEFNSVWHLGDLLSLWFYLHNGTNNTYSSIVMQIALNSTSRMLCAQEMMAFVVIIHFI